LHIASARSVGIAFAALGHLISSKEKEHAMANQHGRHHGHGGGGSHQNANQR
jgi:hypothetical protein